MAKKNYAPGTTSKLEPVKCTNLSTGADMQVLFSDLIAYYCIEGSAPVAVTLVTAAQGTYTNSGGAGTGGGFIATSAAHMPGEHEFSWPDAALASPNKSVRLCIQANGGTSAGMKTIDVEVQLDAYAALVNLVNTLTTYTGNTPQTGDSYARLGSPAGASVSADIAAVEAHAANVDTQVGTAGVGLTNVGGHPQTGDSFARLGAPAGASISADIAQVETHASHVDTQVGTAGAGLTEIPGLSDPWATAVPGSYTAGEAGYILGHLAAGADPLANVVPGSYEPNTAGAALGKVNELYPGPA